jgi:heterotetrameric sarcosine oxidase gamma subunit
VIDTALLATFETGVNERLLTFETWTDSAAFGARFEAAFGATLPAPCRAIGLGVARVLWLEPAVWLLRAPRAEAAALSEKLSTVLGEDGAVTDISGGLVRRRITGPSWRGLLMIGGVFDAESRDFGPGCVAGTVIEHMAVRLDVIDAETVDAYVAPSYAHDLFHFWDRAAARMGQ